MSLKIKCVHYNNVHLATYQDVDVFAEELRVLVASGYTVSVEVTSENTLLQDCGLFKHPSSNRRKYDLGDSTFHYNPTNVTKNDSGSCC